MAALTGDELALLRGTGQRFRLYLALWHTWQIAQDTPLGADLETGEPDPVVAVDDGDFLPVLNLGPHRLAFAGEPIALDASRSWVRGGDPAPDGDWTVLGDTLTGPGPHEVTFPDPGLYEVTYDAGGATATRWVRVLVDRDDQPFDVVAVSGLAGGIDVGWSCQVTCIPDKYGNNPHDSGPQSPGLDDFQAVGIFCEDEWRHDGDWTVQPIGGYVPEPTLLFSGYVTAGSIAVDANGGRVTFALGGLKDQLAAATVHKTSVWGRSQWDVYKAEASASAAGETPLKGGTILELAKTTMPDVVLWLLQFHTNVLPYHDFTTWYDASLQDHLNITGGEGDVWSVLGSWTANEYAWLFCDEGNGLNFLPNPHIRSATAFQGLYPKRLELTDDDVLALTPNERKARNVIYVQISGTQPAKSKKSIARYPSDSPPAGAGTWVVKDDLLISDKNFVVGIAERVYLDANRRWTLSLTVPYRAVSAPARVGLTHTDPNFGIDWDDKAFIVRQASHQFDVGATTWLTSLQLDEVV